MFEEDSKDDFLGALCTDFPGFGTVTKFFPEDAFYNYIVADENIQTNKTDESVNSIVKILYKNRYS